MELSQQKINPSDISVMSFGRKFELALKTHDYIYFVDYNESDDNSNTIIYNNKGNILSDNYFASSSLFTDLCKIKQGKLDFTYMSEDIKKELSKDIYNEEETNDKTEQFKSGGTVKRTKRSIYQDKSIKAMHAGKRESSDGNTYYEYRSNRSDKNRTRRFEEGGSVDTVKVWQLPEHMPDNLLEFDGDQTDLRLHSVDSYSFSGKNETEYDSAVEELEKNNVKGNGWEVYSSYDVGGYGYWTERMNERVRTSITVSFDSEDVPLEEIEKIEIAVLDALNKLYEIEEKYNYDPSNHGDDEYAKGGRIKQIGSQYKRKKYGNRDTSVGAKPVGWRYKKIRDRKTGRLRKVTKDDHQYYKHPSQSLIDDYMDGDKSARGMLYFENRKDHSDKEPLKTFSKYAKGGTVTINGKKANYSVEYKLNADDKMKKGFIIQDTADVWLYDNKKKLVKEGKAIDFSKLIKQGWVKLIKNYNLVNKPTVDVYKDVKNMNYSELRDWISENIVPHLKTAEMYWVDYEGGNSYDYNDHEQSLKNYIEDARNEAEYKNEEDFNKRSGFKIAEDGWSIETEEGDDLEEELSGNTYNSAYLGITNWNIRIYKADDEKYFLIAHPHLHGDIRSGYGDPFVFEGEDYDEVYLDFYEKIVNGRGSIYLEFKDGQEMTFDSEQDSDVWYFKPIKTYKPKKKSAAEKVLTEFESFGSWKGDDFLLEIVNVFNAENPKKTTKKEYGGGIYSDDEYAKGGSIKRTKRSIYQDKNIKAMHAGKRKSSDGNTYYEYRSNRSDKNRTKRFEDGGRISEKQIYDAPSSSGINGHLSHVEPQLIIDGKLGKSIPNVFYNEMDFSKFGLIKSDFTELSNPDNEGYNEAWDEVMHQAKTKYGETLWFNEHGDLMLVPKD